jgi:NRAMP (natural resistance-associated macrophage protein)-like metal ion transporter
VITGAADDDPSGIATYTQTGAQFGYGQLWTVLFMLPFMIAVQEACARIGAVTGQGLAAVVKTHYPRPVLYGVVFLVTAANTVNIGADLGAMAAAANLLVPLPVGLLALLFAGLVLALEIFTSYRVYARILIWLAISLAAYPATLFLVAQPWTELLRATFVPHVELSFAFLFIITGVLGTTISPYMFFWEASQEVEEERARGLLVFGRPSRIGRNFIRAMRIDNAVGMIASNATTWCIIVVAATVLNANGITEVHTAADAAKALEPLVQSFPNAGLWAKAIFAMGIIGLGLLGVPVLAGSASYAVSEAFGWRNGLDLGLRGGRRFYGVIAAATAIGLGLNFVGIDPVQALVFAAVFNGVAAVPLVFLIARIARDERIMGRFRSSRLSNVLVWATFAGMGAAAAAMLLTIGRT